MTRHEEIRERAEALITARLQERSSVEMPAIGQFEPRLLPEYIQEGEGGRLLMPPQVTLSYQPSDYLLRAKHYTTLDTPPPTTYLDPSFVTSLADLYGYEEQEVTQALAEYLQTLLDALFRGRRVTLLHLGDLFVTEEVAGILLLNFLPSEPLLQTLNAPFAPFKPQPLRSGVVLTGTEVSEGAWAEGSERDPAHCSGSDLLRGRPLPNATDCATRQGIVSSARD